MTRAPNILLMICDDLGYGDLTCYGGRGEPTPHIDALARSGAMLTDFHSNGVVCSPTRASLLTGMYPQRTGVRGVISAANHRDVGLDPAIPSLPRWLGDAGYDCVCYGKWHLGYSPEFGPLAHGFREYRGFVSGNIDYQSHIDQTGRFDWWQDRELADEPGYATYLIRDHAVDYLRGRTAKAENDSPFFMYLGWPAPHYPYQGPDDPAEREVGGDFPSHGRRHGDPAAYAEMIRALDASVGEILAALEASGERENTVVIFTSDHGAPGDPGGVTCNGPWRGGKSQLYEGGHRVACILRWPGRIEADLETDPLCMTVDLTATILQAAGLELPATLDGQSLLPLLGAELDFDLIMVQSERTLFWKHHAKLAMRDGHYKLHLDPDGSTALYALHDDPGETHDLHASEPEKTAALRERLEGWDAHMDAISPSAMC